MNTNAFATTSSFPSLGGSPSMYQSNAEAGPSRRLPPFTPSSQSIDLTGEDSDDEGAALTASRSMSANDNNHNNIMRSHSAQIAPGVLNPFSDPRLVSTTSSLPLISSSAQDDIQVTGARLPPRQMAPSLPAMYNPNVLQGYAAPAPPFNTNGAGGGGGGGGGGGYHLTPSPSSNWLPNGTPSYMFNGVGAMGPLGGNFQSGSHLLPTSNPLSTHGTSSSSAIDLTAPGEYKRQNRDPKAAICIGAITTHAVMLYPNPVAVIGQQARDGSKEKLDVVTYRGAEFLKVKLKYRAAGTQPSGSDMWAAPKKDVIQVLTPGLTEYIGDLDASMAQILTSHMTRGLLRLEGYAVRLQPEAHMYQIRLSVLLFTLPSNITYISTALLSNSVYLTDPVPPYDPMRHSQQPEYSNPHTEELIRAQRDPKRSSALGYGYNTYTPAVGQERITGIEIQRRQVDEVFQSLERAGELELSDPGPLIKTGLFPHQQKALSFLLQREQDWSMLKRGRKFADRARKKKTKGAGTVKEPDEDGTGAKGSKSDKGDDEDDATKTSSSHRSLWEGQKDEKGRVRIWKNKVTGDIVKTKKGEKPPDCKGAILADDMGLGKTLSVISLIAATRRSAQRWSKSEVESYSEAAAEKPEINPSVMQTKVFGMPDMPSASDKGKKRKIEDVVAKGPGVVVNSKGTLLVCPMSTISNWEEQIKDHWDGEVEVVGGASGLAPKPMEKKWKPPKKDGESSDDEDEFEKLRVYVYHGPSRRPDPSFLAEFDIVITSYNTLALEYSKQSGSTDDTPGETATNSEDESMGDTSLNPRAVRPEVEAEIKANEVADALRRKKKGSIRPSGDKSALQSVGWFRIVLDEAHYIKTAATVASKASCALYADRRIALTGTPIQNKIEDIWALFRFLRLSPIDDREIFSKYISSPCKAGDQVGVARLQLVMRSCTLRRTKDSQAEDGAKILNLPPRKEMQLWLDLREDERKAYDERQGQAKQTVENLKETNKLQQNYSGILQEILRLRQICDHVELGTSGAVEEDYDGTIMDYQVAVQGINMHGLSQHRGVSVVSFLKEGEGASCVDCGFDYGDWFPSVSLIEMGEQPKPPKKKLAHSLLLTKCLHIYCVKCFKHSVHPGYSKRMKENATRACGVCQMMLRIPTDVIDVIPPDPENPEVEPAKRTTRKKYIRPVGEKPNLSTKMEYLLDQLRKDSRKNPNSPNYDPFYIGNADEEEVEELDQDGKPFIVKSVVFSQWTTMLDRIGDMLEEAQIKYSRLDGTMTREERAKACDSLRHNKKTEVLLVSIRAGGVGLNLTAASKCYLIDPYWNPSVEAQAIDRIHRMGQTRPVTAIKLLIKNSVEQKLDELQRKKASLAQISLNNLSRKDLMAQKAADLAHLFS